MRSKIEKDLQKILGTLDSDQVVTVLVQTNDILSLGEYLQSMVESRKAFVHYNVAPAFGVLILSSSKEMIEKVAKREDVITMRTNKTVCDLTSLPSIEI